MKRKIHAAVFALFFLLALPLGAKAAEFLVPVGKIVGLQLQDDTVTVAAYDDIWGAQAKDAGLRIGDEILRVDGHPVSRAEDVRAALENAEGDISLTVCRGGKTKELSMTPAKTDRGSRLGVYLRQGVAGIGTITWYDPNTGKFGTLGHGVSNGSGELLKMTRGTAFRAQIASVKKGKKGEAGQLKGTAEAGDRYGELLRNTPQGVFGVSKIPFSGQALPVAAYGDIRTGAAAIRSTVQGDAPQEYSVEILKIYPKDRGDSRNFLLKITDPELLAKTGGIVQGMGVSYNRDNQEKPLACNGFWCCPYFPLVTEIVAYHAQVCWTESLEVADHSGG